MKNGQTIEELNNKLKEQLALLEDRNLPINKAMEVYKEAALTLDECYKALDMAKGEMIDINERIENLRAERGEI
jgi:exodeoxyribonuclease VII small subunit